MAMSESNSVPGPGLSEWMQLYHRNLAGHPPEVPPRVVSMFGHTPAVSEATVVTTTLASTATPGPIGMGPGTGAATNLGVGVESLEGRPVRRRTRAARRAPITVLNTDLNNFRAMVQQFTGVPTAPFPSTFRVEGRAGSLGFESGRGAEAIVHPSLPQYHFHHQQHQQHQPQLHQVEGYVLPMGQMNDVFLAGFNSSTRSSNREVSDECFESLSSQNSHTGGGYIG